MEKMRLILITDSGPFPPVLFSNKTTVYFYVYRTYTHTHTHTHCMRSEKSTTTNRTKPKKKTNQSIYFVPDGTDETYESYERDKGLALYAECMPGIVLPSHNLRLLQHFIEMTRFVDDLCERIAYELAIKRAKPFTCTDSGNRMMVEEAEEEEESTLSSIDERDVGQMNVKKLAAVAWRWHDAVVKRKEPLTGEYAYCYALAWVQFCRLYNTALLWHDDGAKAAQYSACVLSLHAYNTAVASSQCIVVSRDPVGRYSMRDMYESARLMVSTLYTCQYSALMRDYVHTIFFRYTTFISQYHHHHHHHHVVGPDDSDSEEDEALGELFDDPSFVLYKPRATPGTCTASHTAVDDDEDEMAALGEAYDAYKQLILVPVHRDYSLRYGYIEAGELLFRLQLTRLDLSRKLSSLAAATAVTVQAAYRVRTDSYADALQLCLKTCCDTASEMSTHKILRGSVCEDYMRQLTRVHLYHGECESFERASPGASNSPDDVLEKLRPNDNLRVAQIRKVPIPGLTAFYSEAMRRVVERVRDQRMNGDAVEAEEEEDDDLAMRVEPRSRVAAPVHTNLFVFHGAQYEREMVLLTRISTIQWLDYETYKYIDELKTVFIIEESSDTQLLHIAQLVADVATATALVQNKNNNHRKGRRQLPVPRKRLPYLVKLMQVYYTVDLNGPGEPRVFATHFFVEAYVAWLAQCVNNGLLGVEQLYKPLRATVELFRGRGYFPQ